MPTGNTLNTSKTMKQEIFDYFSQNHGITLLESEYHDICEVVVRNLTQRNRDLINEIHRVTVDKNRLAKCPETFLNPEENGYAVTPTIRDEVRQALGMKVVETLKGGGCLKKKKMQCDLCGWKGYSNQRLFANHPFRDGSIASGCPGCNGIDVLQELSDLDVCAEPDCWNEPTVGVLTDSVYLFTCDKHNPKR
jgi:hypothetical protein